MSADNPNATEIVEAAAKNARRDVQDIAHDDTIGITLTQLFQVGSRAIYLCKAQKRTFFEQGSKDSANDDLGVPYVKTEAETSITKGRQTPNKQAMAITGISLARRGVRVVLNYQTLGTIGDLANIPEFIAFRSGNMEMIDRSGAFLPFELGGHPGFLEDVLDTIRSRAVIVPKFGSKVSGDPIRADRIPCGDASSGLRAAGSPETFNRLKLPIGYLWQPDNANADSEFAMEMSIPKPFLIAANMPACGFNTAEIAAYPQVLVAQVDFTLRVHGRAVAPTSGNAG